MSSGKNGMGPRVKGPQVLHVGKFYPPQMGGMETHLQSLCEGLQDHIDVRVLVASPHRRPKVERIKGVQVTRLATTTVFAGAPICPGMVKLMRQSDAAIIHLHLPNPAAVLAYLLSGSQAKLVVSYHSDVVRQRTLDAVFRPFLLSALNRAEAILAASPNYLESSTVLSRYRERCRVIPYGIQPGDPGPQDEVERIRATYGSRLVVSVGRLVYYKGFDTLISAMVDVDGHLLIVGDGPMREDLENLARERGVATKVSFAGSVDDVTPFCQAADVFVLASVERSEAFGIVQLEAMACGKPVVNTSLDSGVPFVSRHGESGLTVPPKKPAELARAINQLLDDPRLREEYGRAGRERVQMEFTRERMIKSMVEVYEGIIEVEPRSGRPKARPKPMLTSKSHPRESVT